MTPTFAARDRTLAAWLAWAYAADSLPEIVSMEKQDCRDVIAMLDQMRGSLIAVHQEANKTSAAVSVKAALRTAQTFVDVNLDEYRQKLNAARG